MVFSNVVLALSLLVPPQATPSAGDEARISLDLREADVSDVVRLLAEVGGFQFVVDPGVSCKLTLKLSGVKWVSALDVALRSCGLGREEDNEVVRVAPLAKLTAEAAERRRYEAERQLATPARTVRFRLS